MVVLATVTFLLFFYSATIAMSLMYALDLGATRILRRRAGLARVEGRLVLPPRTTIHATRVCQSVSVRGCHRPRTNFGEPDHYI